MGETHPERKNWIKVTQMKSKNQDAWEEPEKFVQKLLTEELEKLGSWGLPEQD